MRMNTKLLSVPTLMTLVLGAGNLNAYPFTPTAQTISKRFDFAGNAQSTFQDSGIHFFFSDVPADQVVNDRNLSAFSGTTLPERLLGELSHPSEDNSDIYQLTQVYDRLNSDVSGQVVAYHNRSDDTDVNFQVVVGEDTSERIKPNTRYQITAKISFVTNVSTEFFGIGGSPDSNSFGLSVSQNPWVSDVSSIPAPETDATREVDDGLNSYYGISPAFFVEPGELSDLANAAFETLSDEDLSIISRGIDVATGDATEYKAAVVGALASAYEEVLSSLPSPIQSDALRSRISLELDKVIKNKLAAMSADEKTQLKEMFGTPPELMPTVVSDASSPMLRTSTKDSSGNVIPLGVPSGTCMSGELAGKSALNRWICDRYSYMGRINNGLNGSNDDLAHKAWVANSLTTQTPLVFKTDASGQPLYLNINSHSGFEGLTVYYVTGIEYSIVEVE